MSIKLKDTIYDLINKSSQLSTPRTIWGQSFDGTTNVSGNLIGVDGILGFNWLRISSDATKTYGIWVGNTISSSLDAFDLAYNAEKHVFLTGNVGIGTTSPSYKLHVDGTIYGDIKFKTPRTISLTGAVTGSVNFDGTSNVSIITSVNHTHSYLPLTGGTLTGPLVIEPNAKDSLTIGNGIGQFRFQNTSTETSGYSSIYAHQRGQIIFTDTSISSLKFVQYGVSTYRTIYHSGNLTSLSQLTNDTGFITGSYLPLSAGSGKIITGPIYSSASGVILYAKYNNTSYTNVIYVDYSKNVCIYGSPSWNTVVLETSSTASCVYRQTSQIKYTIWDSGNHGSGSGLNADLLDGSHGTAFAKTVKIGSTSYNASDSIVSLPAYPTIPTSLKNPASLTIQLNGTSLGSYDGSSAKTFNITTGTATSANKLSTARKLWGQNFDGTADVNGNITINTTTANAILINSTGTGTYIDFIRCINSNLSTTNHTGHITFGCDYTQYNVGYIGFRFVEKSSKNNYLTLGLHSVDNVLNITGNSYVGIGTTAPTTKLHVVGNIKSTDTIMSAQLQVIGSSSSMPNINFFDGSSNGYHISYRLNNEDSDSNYPLKFYYKTGTTYTQILSINKIGLVKSASDFQGNAFCQTNWNNSVSATVTNFLNQNGSYFRCPVNHGVAQNTVQPIISWHNTINNVGYITRYSIGSYRSNSGWGNMIFMIGNNDGGTTKGIEFSLGGDGSARLDASSFTISSTYSYQIKAHAAGFDIASTANLAPHYITNFAIYKGSPGSGENVLFCDSNKNVGIQTSSPSATCHVNGSLKCSTFYIGNDQITFTT